MAGKSAGSAERIKTFVQWYCYIQKRMAVSREKHVRFFEVKAELAAFLMHHKFVLKND
jgi:hypothetical protein